MKKSFIPLWVEQTSRREWLKRAGFIGTAASLPSWANKAWAQGPSTLNAIPRIALVVGNAKYRDAPLKNPINDAKSISNELQKVGFKVTMQLDAGRVTLVDVIEKFSAELAKSKGVGMFYYAGHGVQLGWRNYLIPVDAEIDKLEDIKTKTVDLSSLLGGISKAANPMNVIILDACRDNPFGTRVPIEQKGLSQFDAPPGSLIAYATAPGNTASDGNGSNGLFTENLLREIRVPNAKIEDVLKRVRLGVRRSSRGEQIPWETTSLEEDFYFLPPASIKKKSEAELDRQYAEQKKEWDRIKDSKNVDDFYAFLNKYPSGFITEQATYQIEQLQKAKIFLQASKNAVAQKYGDQRFRVGDTFTGKLTDAITGKLIMNTYNKVEKIESGLVYLNNKSKDGSYAIRTLDGGLVRVGGARGMFFYDPPRLDMPGDILEVGKRWISRYTVTSEATKEVFIEEVSIAIVAYEEVEVPLGRFWAYRIEVTSPSFKRTFWAQPGWGIELKSVTERFKAQTKEVFELVSRIRGSEVL
ncbi:MAG: caspase family protein [Burkholderiaceae bacterium]|nr:caspase family protein [Burkholderiaceae bacterium]